MPAKPAGIQTHRRALYAHACHVVHTTHTVLCTHSLQKLLSSKLLVASQTKLFSLQVMLSVLNWSAPCVSPHGAQEAQRNMITALAHESPENLGIVLCPVFHYKKSQLFMLEQTMVRSLAGQQVDVDTMFALMFKERLDMRDNRPLLYPGRLVRSQGQKDSDSIWRNTPIMQKNKTEEAQQCVARDMRIPEDLAADACPATTEDQQATVHGSKKVEQIGCDAALKLLDAALEGLSLPQSTALLVCDWHCGVGDVMRAFFERRKAMKNPTFYFWATHDSVLQQWLLHTVQEDRRCKALLVAWGLF